MASGDYLELAQRAARAARFDPSDTTDLTRAKEAINQAYLSSVSGGEQFDFLEQEGQWTTVAGSDTYTYASIGTAITVSGGRVIDMRITNDTDGYVLKGVPSWQDIETLSASTQDGDATGRPLYWTTWGADRIRLYPKPDAAYTMGILARRVPSELSADGDTPLIPLEWRHEVLVSHAAANLLRQEGGGEAHNEATYYQREYESAWGRMRTAHAAARPHSTRFSLKSSNWDDDHFTSRFDDPLGWTR